MKCEVVGGLVAGGGYGGGCEVHSGVTALAVGVLPDALARTPRVDDGRGVACCDVVSERVVLHADREAIDEERDSERVGGEATRTGAMIMATRS